jgi:hypothetical protein
VDLNSIIAVVQLVYASSSKVYTTNIDDYRNFDDLCRKPK